MREEPPFTVKAFFDFLRKGDLMGAKCGDCGGIWVPPRPICPGCGGRRLKWIGMKGKGTVEAVTEIHVAPSKYKEEAPYTIAVIRLDEGPKITARISRGRDEVAVGSRVEADTDEWREGTLTFKPT